MDRAISSLILKANRLLGAELVNHGLITPDQLDEANEAFLDLRRSAPPLSVSVLRIALYQLQCLEERKLLNYQVQELGLSGFNLQNYEPNEELMATFNVDEMFATWTAPVDCVENVYFLASAYYLSPVVRKHWQERLDDAHIVWSVHPSNDIESLISSLPAAVGNNGSGDPALISSN